VCVSKYHKKTPCIALLNNNEKNVIKQEGGIGSVWGIATSKGGKYGKKCDRMNIVQLLCTHVCKYKNETCETIPSIRGLEG
jgi:hypothetical protein